MSRYTGPEGPSLPSSSAVRSSRSSSQAQQVGIYPAGEGFVPAASGCRNTVFKSPREAARDARITPCWKSSSVVTWQHWAKKAKGNTAVTLLQLLETRLDNVVRRLGVVRSIWAARQVVAHGHVRVNGKKLDVASAAVSVGDVITFKDKTGKLLRENMESLAGHTVPAWLEFNPAQLEAKMVALPVPEQIPFEINANLITIEFYPR